MPWGMAVGITPTGACEWGTAYCIHWKDGGCHTFSVQVCAVVTSMVSLLGVISWLLVIVSREEYLHQAALGGMHLKAERLKKNKIK